MGLGHRARCALRACGTIAALQFLEAVGHGTHTMRILLAEDERELGSWLVRALGQSGFQVDWVDDGRLVRHSLKSTRYDALILAVPRRMAEGMAIMHGTDWNGWSPTWMLGHRINGKRV